MRQLGRHRGGAGGLGQQGHAHLELQDGAFEGVRFSCPQQFWCDQAYPKLGAPGKLIVAIWLWYHCGEESKDYVIACAVGVIFSSILSLFP